MLSPVTTKPEIKISAVVTRADGSTYNLGVINGRFPWRAWLYRLRCLFRRRT